MISRRDWLAQAAVASLLVLARRDTWARGISEAGKPSVTVYKTSTCDCCQKWVEYLRGHGFVATVHDLEQSKLDSIKDELGIPDTLRSCHTATLDGYVVEGHVPVEDIERLLAERPEVVGLAAPGMPQSGPGMARPGAPHEPYEVLSFRRDGASKLYAKH